MALAGLLVLGSCNSNTTPTSPAFCVSLTGQYTGVFTDSCGLSKTEDVTLFQTRCAVVAQFPGVGSLQGTVEGQTLVFAIGFAGVSPCGGSASGSATVTSSGGLNGTYRGQATGTGATCCGNVSGTFTLTRR
ncbi:MAG: hypothetical protein PT977_01620 [Acidobacteriota bacterium]|nr:hypothetical protein [Acidobacteriota bacterium]